MAFAIPDLDGAATAELEAELERQAGQLLSRVIEGRERVARLRELAETAAEQLHGDEAMLRHAHALLGRSDQLSLDTLNSHLRGARVREVALQILERRDEARDGVHYRDWYQWVRDAGYTVSGRDPVATFLALVTRSPSIERVGGRRSGRYRMKTALAGRAATSA